MRCPWYLFHRLFRVWARTQGPHDPLFPRGPMSCQSAPGWGHLEDYLRDGLLVQAFWCRGPMRCPWYLFHRLFRVWARTQGPHDPLLPRGP
ncbi:unnamed protein product, partial [Staurois parvus]